MARRFKSAFKISISKYTRNRYLGRSWHRWKVNIAIDLNGISIDTRDWIDKALDTLLEILSEYGIEPLGSKSQGCSWLFTLSR